MTKKEHLPIIGVGPMIVIPQLLLTFVGFMIGEFTNMPRINLGIFKFPCAILGIFLICFGIYLWIFANFKEKLNENIKSNHLITTGVYSWTRNPVYSAFFLICCGVIFMANTLLLFVIPLICWIYMTVFLIKTEEKWLLELYGDDYKAYCKKTNRIIPWKTRNHS